MKIRLGRKWIIIRDNPYNKQFFFSKLKDGFVSHYRNITVIAKLKD